MRLSVLVALLLTNVLAAADDGVWVLVVTDAAISSDLPTEYRGRISHDDFDLLISGENDHRFVHLSDLFTDSDAHDHAALPPGTDPAPALASELYVRGSTVVLISPLDDAYVKRMHLGKTAKPAEAPGL